MRRLVLFGVFLWMLSMISPISRTSAQSTLPLGVPVGSQKATVTAVVDGDTLKVSLNKKGQVIELAGIDAPEEGECFAITTFRYVYSIVPKPTTVYLEDSGISNDTGVTAFVWIPGKDGKKATLLNTKLVREGYAGYLPNPEMARYGERLAGYEGDAKAAGKGLWGKCSDLHGQGLPPTATPDIPPTSTPDIPPTPTPSPEAAIRGLTADEQAYIDGTTEIIDYLGVAFTGLSSQMSASRDNPRLYSDRIWLLDTAIYLVAIQGAYDDGLALTVPDSLASIHSVFLDGLRLYSNAVDRIATAIDDLDFRGINAGANLIAQGNEYITQANDELTEFVESRGV